ncbi:hypothetical protein LCGC14_2319600, partial [marine sediment metagenome]
INEAELEWPFNINTRTDTLTRGIAEYTLPTGYRTADWESFFLFPSDLIINGTFDSATTSWTDKSSGTGSAAHTTDGGGRARLAGGASGTGALEQSVTTIGDKTYRVSFRIFSAAITLKIGTTSGGTEILSEEFTITNTGEGTYYSKTFVATTASTFIGFSHTTNANHDFDTVSVREDLQPSYLQYRSIDIFNAYFREDDFHLEPSTFNTPEFVFATNDDKYIVSPVPDNEYKLEFKYYLPPTVLSSDTDTTTIPTRYEHVIIDRAMFYVFMFREDAESATIMDTRSNIKVEKMRIELINKPDRMYAGVWPRVVTDIFGN